MIWSFVLIAALSLSATAPVAQPSARAPVLTTAHFAIYSDFNVNLNDALINTGLARRNKKPELFHAGADAACFDKLSQPARAAWDRAVDYYAEVVSPGDFTSRQQFLIRLKLAGFDGDWHSGAGAEVVDIAEHFRSAAATAYTACRWAAQDESNRRWIADIQPRLAADEEKIAGRLEQLYVKRWKTLPILVDVVETVNWAGANTSWSDAGQGHILIANQPAGPSGLETLFHESSHVLMDRTDPVRAALDAAAKSAGFRPPNDLWHLVLFYTTGEAVRPILDAHGPPVYTPMLYEIFGRGTWVEYRQALEKTWLPYVQGKKSLTEAAADFIDAIRKQTPGRVAW